MLLLVLVRFILRSTHPNCINSHQLLRKHGLATKMIISDPSQLTAIRQSLFFRGTISIPSILTSNSCAHTSRSFVPRSRTALRRLTNELYYFQRQKPKLFKFSRDGYPILSAKNWTSRSIVGHQYSTIQTGHYYANSFASRTIFRQHWFKTHFFRLQPSNGTRLESYHCHLYQNIPKYAAPFTPATIMGQLGCVVCNA